MTSPVRIVGDSGLPERGGIPAFGSVLPGGYQVLAAIGEGSMGSVYRGERLGLGRPVAIKFLHAAIARDSQFARRFDVEARAMSRLSHPNCISVIDFGFDGVPFLVMDLVDGAPVRAALETGRLPPRRAVSITRQILAGLAHAHSQGIIHRDIKPENILLVQAAGLPDHVRILDFGLAKLRDSGAMLTGGMCLGTPHYMAPEQLREGPVDHRVDLYATGVVLYEMLAGKKPFDAPDVGQVLVQHLQAPPPPFHTVAPEASVSRALESIVQRALAKSPSERFSSAVEMMAALEGLSELSGGGSNGETTVAEPPPARAGEPSSIRGYDFRARAAAAIARAWAQLRTRGPLRLQAARARARVILQQALARARAARGPVLATLARARLVRRRTLVVSLSVVAAFLTVVTWFGRPDQPPPPQAAAARAAPPAAKAAPSPAASKLAPIDDLLAVGEHEKAIGSLRQLRRKHPADADYAAALARLSFEQRRYVEALASFRAAIRLDPQRRSDPVLIEHVIDSLASERIAGAAEELLRDLGNTAKVHVREAARSHPSRRVRARARDLIRDWERRPLFRW